jgi:putative serine protease PepD
MGASNTTKGIETMFRTRILAAIAALAAGAGGLIGAGAVALHSGGSTTTVVRQTTAAATAAVSSAKALSVSEINRRVASGVVEITVTSGGGQSFPFGGGDQQAQGSGFFYDDQHVVTNEHVVDGATSVTVRLADGSTHRATVVGTDASTDLAVLKVDVSADKVHPLTLGNSSALTVGDGVVAIGSPFGLEGTVTSGIVSALHREITAPNDFAIGDAIQTDAAINHGNSGGPLLDLLGRVIGVTAQIRSDSGGNEGVGFAVPSNTVKRVVDQLLSNGSIQHAYLGVSLQSSGRARIASVRAGTPAARAGLHVGDVITKVDLAAVGSDAELRSAVDSHKPGDTIRLTILRNGARQTVSVKLGTRPD